MTAYVSAAAGNWETTTSWTPNGTPGNGDSVTINHAITKTVSGTIGTSPGSCIQGNYSTTITQTVPAITLNGNGGSGWSTQIMTNNPTFASASGALTLAAGITLTVRGDIVGNTGSLTLNAGSTLTFDPSQAAAGTSYVLEPIGTYNRFNGYVSILGTASQPCTITSTVASGWRITAGWRSTGLDGYSADAGILRGVYCTLANGGIPASTLTLNQGFSATAAGANGNVVLTQGSSAPTAQVQNLQNVVFTATCISTGASTVLQWQVPNAQGLSTDMLRMAPAGISMNGGVLKDSNGRLLTILLSAAISQNSSTYLVSVVLTFSGAVVATNTPQIILTNGMACAYASGSGTAALTFTFQAKGIVSLTHVTFENFSPSSSGTLADASGFALCQSNSTGVWFSCAATSTDARAFWTMRAQASTGSNPTPQIYLRNSTVSACTRITGIASGMVGAGYSVMFDDVVFSGGIDNGPVISGQIGYGVTTAGVDIVLSSINAPNAGDIRRVLRCVFTRPVSVLSADYWTRQSCLFAAGWFNASSGVGATILHDSCFDRYQPGYDAGGQSMNIGYSGSQYSNNIMAVDLACLTNTHGITFSSFTGTANFINNVIDYQNTGGGFDNICIGGNWVITYPAGSGTAYSSTNTTGNLANISGNIVCADWNTTNKPSAPYATLANQYLPGGVITQDTATAQVNFAVQINHNILPLPSGIGSVDPNEPGTGPANTFISIKDNIFYRPTYSQNAIGLGHAIWNRTDETIAVDSMPAVNVDYNVVWGGNNDTSYTGCPASTTYAAGQQGTGGTAVTTPGYYAVCCTGSTPPGAHDTHADPLFVDDSRSTVAYDLAHGGPGTIANLVAQLITAQATGVFYGNSGYTLATAINAVRIWIQQGFSPRNPVMFRRAHDGTTVGAVQVNAPYQSLVVA